MRRMLGKVAVAAVIAGTISVVAVPAAPADAAPVCVPGTAVCVDLVGTVDPVLQGLLNLKLFKS